MRGFGRLAGVFAGVLVCVVGAVMGQATGPGGGAATGPVVATKHPAVFLVGDSLMKTGTGDGSTGPWGYGSELIGMFDASKVTVYNEGRGGRSSRGYREEGVWTGVLKRIEKGDWVVIDFGHNDAANSTNYPDRISGKGGGDELMEVDAPGGEKKVHTYGWYLREYVREAKEKGANVVIVSPIPRNRWDGDKVRRGFDGYAELAAEAAKASGAFYVDLNGLAADRLDAMKAEEGKKLFNDTQHTTKAGAKMNAEAVVAGLKKLEGCGLVEWLVK